MPGGCGVAYRVSGVPVVPAILGSPDGPGGSGGRGVGGGAGGRKFGQNPKEQQLFFRETFPKMKM